MLVLEKGEAKKASVFGPMDGGRGMSEKAEARDDEELKPPREEVDRTEAEESDGGDAGGGRERCPWAAMASKALGQRTAELFSLLPYILSRPSPPLLCSSNTRYRCSPTLNPHTPMFISLLGRGSHIQDPR
jgi:hypothetical protein